jgi:2-polyprenylphenol 6-hydroxylase
MSDQYDIAVIGAGVVGMACALALAEQRLSVVLIAPTSSGAAAAASTATSADPRVAIDWDPRIFALSPGSRALLTRLRIWPELPAERIGPIYSMQIRGPDHAVLKFDAYEAGIPALAYTVENRALTTALAPALRFAGVVRLDASVQAHRVEADAVLLELDDGTTVGAHLLVAADGANSVLRTQAGIRVEHKSYGQRAIVANFRAERPHLDCAYQWFTEEGVVAWLPLGSDAEGGALVSLVWSAPDELATALLASDGGALAERAAQAGHRLLGTFEPLGAVQAYPLAEVRVRSLIGPRLALVGDAAHLVHPLAGLGMNLGLQDVAALAQVVAEREPLRQLGDPLLLRRYQRRRREAVLLAQATLDALHRAFYRAPPGFKRLREFGWRALESNRWLKRQLIAQAAL